MNISWSHEHFLETWIFPEIVNISWDHEYFPGLWIFPGIINISWDHEYFLGSWIFHWEYFLDVKPSPQSRTFSLSLHKVASMFNTGSTSVSQRLGLWIYLTNLLLHFVSLDMFIVVFRNIAKFQRFLGKSLYLLPPLLLLPSLPLYTKPSSCPTSSPSPSYRHYPLTNHNILPSIWYFPPFNVIFSFFNVAFSFYDVVFSPFNVVFSPFNLVFSFFECASKKENATLKRENITLKGENVTLKGGEYHIEREKYHFERGKYHIGRENTWLKGRKCKKKIPHLDLLNVFDTPTCKYNKFGMFCRYSVIIMRYK